MTNGSHPKPASPKTDAKANEAKTVTGKAGTPDGKGPKPASK